MPPAPTLTTARLRLRPWRDADLPALAEMYADPRVMEFMPKLLTREETSAHLDRMREHFEQHGFGLWAVEVLGIADYIGFVGLNKPSFEAHFTPCVEIGWRLAFAYWGHGYATEGAQSALRFGFDTLRLEEIVSFTVPANVRSRAVMHRLGMTHRLQEDFDHLLLPAGHPLRRHVLYRLSRPTQGGD